MQKDRPSFTDCVAGSLLGNAVFPRATGCFTLHLIADCERYYS